MNNNSNNNNNNNKICERYERLVMQTVPPPQLKTKLSATMYINEAYLLF